MLIADLLHLDPDQRITHRRRNELAVAVQEEVRGHLGRGPDLFLIGPGRLLHEFPRVDGYSGESELRVDDPTSARLSTCRRGKASRDRGGDSRRRASSSSPSPAPRLARRFRRGSRWRREAGARTNQDHRHGRIGWRRTERVGAGNLAEHPIARRSMLHQSHCVVSCGKRSLSERRVSASRKFQMDGRYWGGSCHCTHGYQMSDFDH